MFGFASHIPDQWNIPENSSDLEDLMADSEKRIQFIFKHSTRCAISSMAKRSLLRLDTSVFQNADLHYVDVIANRRLSNEIAVDLSVMHHSPQLIAVHKAKVIWQGSHSEVRKESIEELISRQAESQ